MKAHLAALALAGLVATTAMATQDATTTDDPARAPQSDQQQLSDDAHGYRNTKPGESSPNPRMDDEEGDDRDEQADSPGSDDARQPEQR